MKSEYVKISRQALRNMAKTLEMALLALEGDELAIIVYKHIEVTPEEVIKRKIDTLRVMADGIGILYKEGQDETL